MSKKSMEILFIGLALFATYFGAGNMIFPPIIGLQSGTGWLSSIAGLAFSGILLPVLAMIVIGLCGSVTNITKHVSKNFYNIIIGAIMFIVAFVANPRTVATAIEMGVQGIIPQIPYIPCVIIYFIVVFLPARNKGSALDNVGKYLTPGMVVFSNPLYTAIYPVVLVLLLLGIFNKVIPNDGGYKGAVALDLVYSICEAILSIGIPMGGLQKIISSMPLAADGFGWFAPCIVGFFLILFIMIYKVFRELFD